MSVKLHIHAALNVGCQPEEIAEVIFQTPSTQAFGHQCGIKGPQRHPGRKGNVAVGLTRKFAPLVYLGSFREVFKTLLAKLVFLDLATGGQGKLSKNATYLGIL